MTEIIAHHGLFKNTDLHVDDFGAGAGWVRVFHLRAVDDRGEPVHPPAASPSGQLACTLSLMGGSLPAGDATAIRR